MHLLFQDQLLLPGEQVEQVVLHRALAMSPPLGLREALLHLVLSVQPLEVLEEMVILFLCSLLSPPVMVVQAQVDHITYQVLGVWPVEDLVRVVVCYHMVHKLY